MRHAIRIGGYVARGTMLGAHTGTRLDLGRTARSMLTRASAALVTATPSCRSCTRSASTAAAAAIVESPEDTVVISQVPTLRPYQEECVQECLANLAEGITRIGVSSPTGSGKVRSGYFQVCCHCR